jgi:hypothetical protein
MTTELEWQFGGWLRSVPPIVAWAILAGVAVGGMALIIYFYRRTLRKLPRGQRITLGIMRVLLLAAVFLLLANPSRVERPKTPAKDARRLDVLVDRSASMYSVDNRNETRLENAARTWKQHTDEAAKAYDQIDHFRFANHLEKADSLDAALKTGGQGDQTQLWQALDDAMKQSPAGIVSLTDGLDTSGQAADALIQEAQTRGIPLYFVPAQNRSRPENFLTIRDMKTPSKVLRRTQFKAAIIAEISTLHDRDIPVELWSGSQKLAETTLKARAGWNVMPWTPQVTSGDPGVMPLEFRLGAGDEQETAASTTQVVDHTAVDVLYYQGALQWGYRFLRAALETDPSFHLTSILNPALGVKIATPSATTMDDLPDTEEGLKKFQIVILAHVLADQLSAKQMQALIDYAKDGGGVLFIAPDSDATKKFAGTPLETMLPIVFDSGGESTEQRAAHSFEAQMRNAFESNNSDSGEPGDNNLEEPTLLAFQVEQGGGTVFKNGEAVPMFSNFAKIARAKPGAQVLAVHPSEKTADDLPRILMARQQFGEGFTVAMATDLLWRWKMSLPSDSKAPEIFWQQLMLSLAPSTGEGIRIVKGSSMAAVNRGVTLTVEGVDGDTPPNVAAVSPAGKRQTLPATKADGSWQATLTPDIEGRWQLIATGTADDTASMTLPVEKELRTAENSNAPPDLDGMRRIAEATGGALITSDPVFQQQAAESAGGVELKTSQPAWNETWLLGLLLGLYGTELIVRRIFRLV